MMRLLAFAATLLSLGASPGSAADTCRRVALDPAPRWLSSVAQDPSGEAFFTVDPVRNEVGRYAMSGVRMDVLEPQKTDLGGGFLPTHFVPESSGRYLLHLQDEVVRLRLPAGRLERVSISARRNTGNSLRILSAARKAEARVGGIFRWSPFGGSLLAYGDVQRGHELWTSGFLLVPFEAPQEFALVREIPLDSTARDLYLMLDPVTATTAGSGFFLAFDQPPAVYRVSAAGATERTLAFGVEEARLEPLPGPRGLAGIAARYAAVEAATLPVGLFARNGRLAVLLRRPAVADVAGSTAWSLLMVDASSGRILDRKHLPTSAAHVAIAPGPESWVVIERGRVEGLGVQQITEALIVPAKWIEESGGPLSGGAPTLTCR